MRVLTRCGPHRARLCVLLHWAAGGCLRQARRGQAAGRWRRSCPHCCMAVPRAVRSHVCMGCAPRSTARCPPQGLLWQQTGSCTWIFQPTSPRAVRAAAAAAGAPTACAGCRHRHRECVVCVGGVGGVDAAQTPNKWGADSTACARNTCSDMLYAGLLTLHARLIVWPHRMVCAGALHQPRHVSTWQA